MQIALFPWPVIGHCREGGGVSRLKYLILILPIRISCIPMIPPSLTVNWHSYSPPFLYSVNDDSFPLCSRTKLFCSFPPPPSRSYPVINRLVLQLEFIRGQLSVMNSCIYQAACKFELSTLRRLIVWHSKNAAYTSILVIDCEICLLAHARFLLSRNAPKRGHWETTGTRRKLNGAIQNKVNLVPRASAIAFQQHYTNSYSQM